MYARGATPLRSVHGRMTAARAPPSRSPAGAGRDVRVLDARDDAGDERPVERLVAVERRAARAGAGEPARDDHLRRRPAAGPFGKPGRVREPGRREERVLVVDAVVDDRDLDALALGAGERRRTAGAPITAGPLFIWLVYV